MNALRLNFPFAHLPFAQQALLFLILLALTLLVMGILTIMGRPLTKAGASIVDFELAGTLPNAQAIMHGWGAANRQRALRQTYVDFAFILLYALTLALGCGLAARQFTAGGALATLGPYLAWAQLTAGLLDVVENVTLMRLLQGSTNASWPQLARWCALPKFAIVGLGVVYELMGGAAWLLPR